MLGGYVKSYQRAEPAALDAARLALQVESGVPRCPPGHLPKTRSPGTIGVGWGRVSRITLGRKLAAVSAEAMYLQEWLRFIVCTDARRLSNSLGVTSVLTRPHLVEWKGTDE